ncbi:MAG: glycosyltransferase family 2 protein [candidate division Zixibacteria bacterium]|nr:glycosyltransferase family 2 protein [candidate division Zixibacteria bacterium]
MKELTSRIKALEYPLDILIVNDGSTDNTNEVIKDLDVFSLINDPNQGKGYTLKRGCDWAVKHGYKFVITIDADLQHLPEEIPRFLGNGNKADVIIGTRDIRLEVMPPHRWLTNNLTSLIISVFSGARVRDSQSGYRLLATKALRMVEVKSVKYDYESEILFQVGALGAAIGEVPISTVYEGSHSYINPLVDTGRFIRQIWKRLWL